MIDGAGKKIIQLISDGPEGEGWVFLYEHLAPVPNLSIGDLLKRGQKVGEARSPEGFTTHFQLGYIFNDYLYTKKQ